MALTERDFVSVDAAQVFAPRAADGSLPMLTFLHVAEESALSDAGVAVGLPFREAKPDLGVFERRASRWLQMTAGSPEETCAASGRKVRWSWRWSRHAPP